MKARILNFRGGRHTKYNNQMIIKIQDINNKEEASKLIKKEVVWKTPSGKEIKGKISNIHGNNGCLKVLFEKGMPGQSIATELEVK